MVQWLKGLSVDDSQVAKTIMKFSSWVEGPNRRQHRFPKSPPGLWQARALRLPGLIPNDESREAIFITQPSIAGLSPMDLNS